MRKNGKRVMRKKGIIRILAVFGVVLAGVILWRLLIFPMTPAGGGESDATETAGNGIENVSGAEDGQERGAEGVDTGQGAESGNIVITDELRSDIESGYLILVNKTHALDEGYKPDDLTGIKYYAEDRSAEGRYMRAKAADAFHSLVEEAGRQDMTLVMTTAYRSYGFQSVLYNNYVAQDGQAAADRYSAKPGRSEHQTGLSTDVSAPSVGYRLTQDFADTEEGKWLAENAHSFGFIIRFPEGQEEITGYMYEPWHIRYVGLTAAKYIYENEITLEEYLQLLEMEV